MPNLRLSRICLSTGIAIVLIEAALIFAVPPWADGLRDKGFKVDDLGAGSKMLIDLSSVFKYYWMTLSPIPLALIVIGLALTLKGRSKQQPQQTSETS